MKFEAIIHEPMFEYNNKKYIRLIIPDNCKEIIKNIHSNKSHLLLNNNIDNPIDGNILTIKVPFRYRRVMCNVAGKPVQSLIKGDIVNIETDYMGVWNVGNFSGHTWKLASITSQ